MKTFTKTDVFLSVFVQNGTGTAQQFKRGGGLNVERSEVRWGPGACPRKIFETTPFRTSENAPFKERCVCVCV